MRQQAMGSRLLTVLIFLCVMHSSCAASRSVSVVALPNGFYVQPNKKAQASIVKRSGGTVLPGPIAAYAVFRHIVTGALGEPSAQSRAYTNDLPFHGSADTRYFVLDTSTGKLESDLTESAWKQRLEALGVPPSLEIYAPVLVL